MLAIAGLALSGTPAHASGCNFQFRVAWDHQPTRPGESGTLLVYLAGLGDHSGCASDLDVALTPPGGAPQTVASDVVVGGAAAEFVAASVPYTVPADSKASTLDFQVDLSDHGTRQSEGTAYSVLTLTRPHLTVVTTPSAAAAPAPFAVTFDYLVTNDGDSDVSGLQLSDDACPVTGVPQSLIAGKTVHVTCATTLATPSRATSHATATATASSDHKPVSSATTVTGVAATGLTLSATASPAGPLSAIYSYGLTAVGPAVSGVAVVDDHCGPVTYTGGDANGNGRLDEGELWTFTCSAAFPSPGTVDSAAVASGSTDAGPVSSAPASTRVSVAAVLPAAVPTPTPPPKPKRVKVTLRSGFLPPPGLSRARACRGTVKVKLMAGKRVLATKTVKLGRNCHYTVTFDILRSALRGTTVVTLSARFGGNAVLNPKSAKYKQKV